MPEIPTLEADPCARAEALRGIRDKIITGGGLAEFETESGNGVRRRVKYSAADLTRLDAQIAEAENRCRIKNGKRARRFAVTPRAGGW